MGAWIGRTTAVIASRWAWLTVPAVLFLLLFFLVPLVTIGARSVTDPTLGFGNFAEVFRSNVFRGVFLNTLYISLVVTLVCLMLGYPYAYLMTHVSKSWAGVMLLVVLLPFWSSLLVRTYAWVVILQDSGIINSFLINAGIVEEPLPLVRNFRGVVIGMVHILLPFMVLPIYAVMQRIDLSFVKAAGNLGASPFTAFRHIFLPLSLPGVYAGSLLVFVIGLGFYITPALLGDPRQAMLGEIVAQQVGDLGNWGIGSALALILLIVTLVALAAASRLVRIGDAFSGGKRT